MVTGVSSPPWMTNLRGRMLAATRMPLTATGSGPGSTVLIVRMVARSGLNSAAPASAARASTTPDDTQLPRILTPDQVAGRIEQVARSPHGARRNAGTALPD